MRPRKPKPTASVGPICPKCAANKGEWIGPRYQVSEKRIKHRTMTTVELEVIPAYLSYVCSSCGYNRQEPCADAKETK